MVKNAKKEEGYIAHPAKNAADVTPVGGTTASSYANNITTTPGLKTPAEALFAMLAVGKANALKASVRDNYDKVQRQFRELVREARREGVLIVNTGSGDGYYIADVRSEEEVKEVEHMINMFMSRATDLAATAAAMRASLYNQKEEAE